MAAVGQPGCHALRREAREAGGGHPIHRRNAKRPPKHPVFGSAASLFWCFQLTYFSFARTEGAIRVEEGLVYAPTVFARF
jgi:hypothetical protein